MLLVLKAIMSVCLFLYHTDPRFVTIHAFDRWMDEHTDTFLATRPHINAAW